MYGKMRFLLFFGGVIFPSLVLLVGGEGCDFKRLEISPKILAVEPRFFVTKYLPLSFTFPLSSEPNLWLKRGILEWGLAYWVVL